MKELKELVGKKIIHYAPSSPKTFLIEDGSAYHITFGDNPDEVARLFWNVKNIIGKEILAVYQEILTFPLYKRTTISVVQIKAKGGMVGTIILEREEEISWARAKDKELDARLKAKNVTRLYELPKAGMLQYPEDLESLDRITMKPYESTMGWWVRGWFTHFGNIRTGPLANQLLSPSHLFESLILDEVQDANEVIEFLTYLRDNTPHKFEFGRLLELCNYYTQTEYSLCRDTLVMLYQREDYDDIDEDIRDYFGALPEKVFNLNERIRRDVLKKKKAEYWLNRSIEEEL